MMRLLLALLTACVVAAPGATSAHALDPGYLNLSALGQDRWRVTWRAPDVQGRPMAIKARLPGGCSGAAPPLVFDGRAWTAAWVASCPSGLSGGMIGIGGLDRTSTDTLVRYELTPGRTQFHRLTASQTAFTVPQDPGFLDILSSYAALGVSHILEGVDHLLFVLALVLLIPDRLRLIGAVTAFTVAHSVTLAAASLGWLRIPAPPVEAVIALSIVFLAHELSQPPSARDPVAARFPWIVSFAFGLIHGLGFADALREIGLPEGDIPLALLAFNVGVEIGQLLFIALILALSASVRLFFPEIKSRAAMLTCVSGYPIGGMGAFWLIDRIAGF